MCNDLAASARRMDEMPAHLALWPFHGHNRQRQDRRTTISRCKFNPGPPHCNIRAYADNLHSIISKSTRMALVGKCCATGTVMPQDTAHSRNLPHAASCDVTQGCRALHLSRVAMVSFGCMQHKLQYRFFVGVIEAPTEFRELPAHTMLDLSTIS